MPGNAYFNAGTQAVKEVKVANPTFNAGTQAVKSAYAQQNAKPEFMVLTFTPVASTSSYYWS